MDMKDLAIQLFCEFDHDEKGFITKEELLSSISNQDGPFSELQISSIFNLLDKDEKGIITLSNFTNAFLELSSPNNFSEYDHDNDDNKNEDSISNENFCGHTSTNYIDSEKTLINEDVYLCSTDRNDDDDSNDNVGNYNNNVPDIITNDEYSCRFQKDEYENYDIDECNEFFQMGSEANSFQNGDLSPMALTYTDEDLSDDNSSDDVSIKERYLNRKNIRTIKENNPFLFPPDHHGQLSNNLDKSRLRSHTLEEQKLLKENSLSYKQAENNGNSSFLNRRWRSCEFDATNDTPSSKELCNTFNEACHPVNNLYEDKLNSISACRTNNEIIINDSIHPIKKREHRISRSCSCLAAKPLNKLRQKRLSYQYSVNMFATSDDGRYEDSLQRSHSVNDLLMNRKRLSVPSYNKQNSDEYLRGDIEKEILLPIIDDGFVSPRDHDNEDWQSFLKRLHSVSLFGGNQSLRYIWQQLGAYQKDLLIPLEDFIKAVAQEHKTVYSKCQDIENTLHLKIEQHDKEINQLYEDFDRTTLRELDDYEKKHIEREESIKSEYRQLLDYKEQAFQEHIKYTNELSAKLESYENELVSLREDKKRLEGQLRSVISEQQVLLSESETVTQENEGLREKLAFSNDNIREIQDYLAQVTKDHEKERAKHKSFMRRFKDLLEEKEFLEISLTALSTENEELRNKKTVSEAIMNDTIPLDECDEERLDITQPDMCSSPLNKTQIFAHGVSIHEEINALDYEMHMDSINTNTNLNESTKNFLEQTQEFDMIASTDESLNVRNFLQTSRTFTPVEEIDLPETKSDLVDGLQRNKTSTPVKKTRKEEEFQKQLNKNNSKVSLIRFVSPMQTEFKVIFCGKIEVGKTSLIQRICLNKFCEEREKTLQLDIYKKSIQIDNSSLNLSFWDSLGQERYDSLPVSYYRKSDVAVITYDVTNGESFNVAEMKLNDIRDFTHENVLVFLLGNKIDLEENRVIGRVDGEELAERYDAIFMETSAKAPENISNLLALIAKALLLQHEYVFIHNNFDRSVTSILKNKSEFEHMKKCC